MVDVKPQYRIGAEKKKFGTQFYFLLEQKILDELKMFLLVLPELKMFLLLLDKIRICDIQYFGRTE